MANLKVTLKVAPPLASNKAQKSHTAALIPIYSIQVITLSKLRVWVVVFLAQKVALCTSPLKRMQFNDYFFIKCSAVGAEQLEGACTGSDEVSVITA